MSIYSVVRSFFYLFWAALHVREEAHALSEPQQFIDIADGQRQHLQRMRHDAKTAQREQQIAPFEQRRVGVKIAVGQRQDEIVRPPVSGAKVPPAG